VLTALLLWRDAQAQLAPLPPPLDPHCGPVVPRASSSLPSWDKDLLYTRKRDVTPVGEILYYVGDILRIDNVNFASVVREMNAARSDVRRITFDAREIYIEGPLSFSSAKIEFLADRIVFGRGARITFADAPFASQPDGISLITKSLEFADSLPVPLQVELDPDTPRAIRISASTITVNGKSVPIAQASRFLYRKTLSGAYALSPQSAKTFDVSTGPEANKVFADNLNSHMSWPAYTVAKLIKFHNRNPYDTANLGDLQARMAGLRPLIQASGSPTAILNFERLATRIHTGVDEHGHSAYFAPRTLLSEQINLYTSQTADEAKYFGELRDLIVAAYQQPTLDASQVDEVNAKIKEASTKIASFDSEMDQLKNQNTRLTTEFGNIKTQIGQVQSDVARAKKEAVEKAKTAGDIQQGVQLGAMAVGVGASFIVGPEAAAAAAAGARGVGGLIYANNTGGVDLKSISGVLADSAQYYDQMKGVFDAWSKYKKAEGEGVKVLIDGGTIQVEDPPGSKKMRPMTKSEAGTAWAGKIKGLYDSFYAAWDKAKPAKPTPVDLSEEEKSDPRLASLLSQLADVQSEESKVGEKLNDLLASQTTAKETEQQQVMMLRQLVDTKPVNNAEYERWRSVGLALWQQEVSAVVYDAYTLRRAVFYATGGDVQLDTDAAAYLAELEAAMATGKYDPLFEHDSDDKAEDIQKKLNSQITKLTTVLEGVQKGATRRWATYLNEEAKQPGQFREPYVLSDDSADPQVRNFITAINGQILQQVAGHRELKNLMALPIPFSLRARAMRGPEMLVRATITSVELKGAGETLENSGLTFHIIHPGYGQIEWQNGSCSIVDMRVPNASVARTWVVPATSINSEWLKADPSKVDILDRGSFYTYFPSHTVLLLLTQADSIDHKWKAVPQLKSITVSLEILQ
jgi:hypothetical protein